jgi:hypothetical protein
MLIKVATAHHADSYVLFDHASNVRFQSNPQQLTDPNDLYDWIELQQGNETSLLILSPMPITTLPLRDELGNHYARFAEMVGPLSDKRVYRVNTVQFEREGRLRSVAFDTIAYICTDEGKTLEKALAGGVLNY